MQIWEIEDRTTRKIYLSKKQWCHITEEHPEISNPEELKKALQIPTKLTFPSPSIGYYYKHVKNNSLGSYLLVIVKYLNGEGFVITAYYVRKIK